MTKIIFKGGTGRSSCNLCGNTIEKHEKEAHLKTWNVSEHYCEYCIKRKFEEVK